MGALGPADVDGRASERSGRARSAGRHRPGRSPTVLHTRPAAALGRLLPDRTFVFRRELVPFPPETVPGAVNHQLASAGESPIARVRGLPPPPQGLAIR